MLKSRDSKVDYDPVIAHKLVRCFCLVVSEKKLFGTLHRCLRN